MARDAITSGATLSCLETGIIPQDNDVAANTTDGNSFVWKEGRQLCILNGDDASITVTVVTPATVGRSALAVGDASLVIATTKFGIMGPFGPEYRKADGTVDVNYAGTTMTGVMVCTMDSKP